MERTHIFATNLVYFEIYAAHALANCDFNIIFPPEEKIALETDFFGEQGDLDDLYKMFARTKVQNAESTYQEDRNRILGMIKDKDALNEKVNGLLRCWIWGTSAEVIEDRLSKKTLEPGTDLDEKSVHRVIRYGHFMMRNGELKESLKFHFQMLRKLN